MSKKNIQVKTNEFNGKNFIEVSVKMAIGGQLYAGKKKFYKSSLSTCGTDLEQIAQIILTYERMYNLPNTNADYFLNAIKDKVTNKNGLSVDELIQKYWVNHKQTLEEEFEQRNKAGEEGRWWGPLENDYLKANAILWLEGFAKMPYPLQLAVLYGISYICGGRNDLNKELDNCPQWIRDIVDGMVVKNEQ